MVVVVGRAVIVVPVVAHYTHTTILPHAATPTGLQERLGRVEGRAPRAMPRAAGR